jgi:hypothetical protein
MKTYEGVEKELPVPTAYAEWAPEPVWTLSRETFPTLAGNRIPAVQPAVRRDTHVNEDQTSFTYRVGRG